MSEHTIGWFISTESYVPEGALEPERHYLVSNDHEEVHNNWTTLPWRAWQFESEERATRMLNRIVRERDFNEHFGRPRGAEEPHFALELAEIHYKPKEYVKFENGQTVRTRIKTATGPCPF